MRPLFIISILLIYLFIPIHSHAQCTVDDSYTVAGIYPNPLPVGFAGQPYSEDITFVMPTDTSGATINNFEIVSIALPVGLSWVCNNAANGCNYNPQTNIYGCIHVSGTPLVIGQYDVDVSVLCDVTSSGQNIDNVPVEFTMSFNVTNPAIGNTGFTSSPIMGCTPLTVNFTNNNPGLLKYEWDFGNGQTSNLENPPTQTYSQSGNYPVQYSGYSSLDTIDLYNLSEVTIHNISGGWGPEYIPFVYTNNKPDPYFIVRENGNLIYQSNFIHNDNGPNTWQVNINLHPDSNYTIDVMDADQTAASASQYELTFGADDFIGTHNMNFISCNSCTAGSDATVSTVISYQEILPVPSVQSLDTVKVGTPPGNPNIVYDSSNYIVYTDSSQYVLQWHLDTTSLSGHTSPTDTITQTGNYYVISYNSYGCSASSDTVSIIYCDPAVSFNIGLDGAQNLYVTNFTNGYTVSWYNNGQLINGANNSLLTPSANGDYQALLTSTSGCKYFSNNFTYNVGISEHQSDWWSFPNPANDQLHILWPKEKQFEELEIYDLNGKLIEHIQLINSPTVVPTYFLNDGIYLLQIISSDGNRYLKKQIIQH